MNKWDQDRQLKYKVKEKKRQNVVKAKKTTKNLSAVRPKAFWCATVQGSKALNVQSLWPYISASGNLF